MAFDPKAFLDGRPAVLPDAKKYSLPFDENDFNAKRTRVKRFDDYVDLFSKSYGDDLPELPNLVRAVIMRESGGNPLAKSGAGAGGLMQIMPDTFMGLGGAHPDDRFNPVDNLDKGVQYLAQQLRRFKSPELALAAYNSGPGNVQKHGGIPPFKETQDYIPAVMGYFGAIEQGGITSPSQSVVSNLETAPDSPQPPAFDPAAFLAKDAFQSLPKPQPIPGIPGLGGENLPIPKAKEGPNLSWDPEETQRQFAAEQEQRVASAARGREYLQRKEAYLKENPMALYTPEKDAALQQGHGQDNRSWVGRNLGDIPGAVRNVTQHITAGTRGGYDVAMGQRAQRTEQELDQKAAGQEPGIVEQLREAGKAMVEHPDEAVKEIGLALLEDAPLNALATFGLGAIIRGTKAALGARRAGDLARAAQKAGKSPEVIERALRMGEYNQGVHRAQEALTKTPMNQVLGREVGENVAGAAVVSVPQAEGEGRTYGGADAFQDLVVGTAMGAPLGLLRAAKDTRISRADFEKVKDVALVVGMEKHPAIHEMLPVFRALAESPEMKGVRFSVDGENTGVKYWSREELDAAGYQDREPGDYEAAGETGRDGKIILRRSAGRETQLEEAAHFLQDRLREKAKTENNHKPGPYIALQNQIKAWEEAVRAQARQDGVKLPEGDELFAQTFTAHMGYADKFPESVRRVVMPDPILDGFRQLIGEDPILRGATEKPKGDIDGSGLRPENTPVETVEEILRGNDKDARQKWLRILFPEYAPGGDIGQPMRRSDPMGYAIATELMDPADATYKPVTPRDVDVRGAYEKRVAKPAKINEAPRLETDQTFDEDAGKSYKQLFDEGKIPFQLKPAENAGIPEGRESDPKILERARQLWNEKGTESPFFKRWFGESKATEESGQPKRLFHGTNQDINRFLKAKRGANTNSVSAKEGFYFTESADEAADYADMSARKQVSNAAQAEANAERLLKAINQAENRGDFDRAEKLYMELEESEQEGMSGTVQGANIMPVYLHVKNPLVVDFKGSVDLHVMKNKILQAKDAGHDGLKMLNVFDPVADRQGLAPVTQWVVFNPNQIKSVSGNRGTFSPKSPDIRFQLKPVEQDIQNPIDPGAEPKEKVKQLYRLSKTNQPGIDAALKKVDEELGTFSKSSYKKPENILSKSERPSIKKEKPWFGVEHVRDSFRFKTVVNTIEDVRNALETVVKETGAEVIKADVGKIRKPREWGWRMASFDLKMPNGQLVEYYMPLKELEAAKKAGNHELFEKWRNVDLEELQDQNPRHHEEFVRDMRLSRRRYQAAWRLAMDRLGLDATASDAALKALESWGSSSTGKKLSFKSSADGVDLRQTPFSRTTENSSQATQRRSESGSSETINNSGSSISKSSNSNIQPDGENGKSRFQLKDLGPDDPLDEGKSTGKPPRVESRVVNMRREEAAGDRIPATLALQDKETWESLEPEVRKLLREHDADHFMNIVKQGESLRSAEVQAFDALVRGKQERTEELRQASIKDPSNAQAKQEYLGAQMDYIAAEKAMINDGTGTARALAARNRIMRSRGVDSDANMIRKISKEIPGMTDKTVGQLVRIWRDTPEKFPDALRQAMAFSKADKGLELWKAGLLSAPSTDLANITGNAIEHATRMVEAAISGGVDWAIQKLDGGKRARFVADAAAEFSGTREAFAPALKHFAMGMKDVFLLKDKPLDLSAKFEFQTGAVGGTLGKVARTSFRKLEVEDQFFKDIIAKAELRKHAYRAALAEGKKGKAAMDRGLAIEAEVYKTPEKYTDILKAVKDAQQVRTFQGETGALAKLIMRANQMVKATQVVMPFVKTPANIFKVTLERSPLGWRKAAKAFQAYRTGLKGDLKPAEVQKLRGDAADAIGRATLGTTILAGFAGLAASGAMTGGGPTNAKEKNLLRETGWQPYSFVYTDGSGKKHWIPFSRFEPISSLLGIAADIVEIHDQKEAGDMAEKAVGAIAENLINKSYLQGLSDAAAFITEPKQFGRRYLSGLAGSIVPNVVSRAAKGFDPIMRDVTPEKTGFMGYPEAIAKTVQSRIPFASRNLPAKRSGTGDEIRRPGSAFGRFAGPIQISDEKSGAASREELLSIGFVPSQPPREITVPGTGKKVRVTDEEFEILAQARARALERFEAAAKHPGWKNVNPKRKQQLARSLFDKEMDIAKARIMPAAARRLKLSLKTTP